jgi:hypothetical protein
VVVASNLAYTDKAVRLPADVPAARELLVAPRTEAPAAAAPPASLAPERAPAPVAPEASTRVVLEATRDAGVSFFYAVPCRVVDTCDSAPAQKLTARLADGGPLPEWLKFDANTATFFGQAPAQTRTVVVKVLPAGRGAEFNPDNATVVTLKFLGSGAVAKR